MTTDPITSAHGHRRLARDSGVAMVEFAFVMVMLFTLIFGMINYGVILSFKQDLTRVAAEGARAGAVAFPASDAFADAKAATEQSITAIGKTCNNGTGMTCNEYLHDCDFTGPFPQTSANDPTKDDCIRVEVSFDYKGHPILPPPPVIGGLVMPETIAASSDARVNE